MDFYTSSKTERPVRLSEATRLFAYESMYLFKYGIDTEKCSGVSLDGIENFENLTPLEKYDLAVSEIASRAPIRICSGEKVSGAATLGAAIQHLVPAYYKGTPVFFSVSHLTTDYETILRIGYSGLREKINLAASACTEPEKLPFYKSLEQTVNSFEIWHRRYLSALKQKHGCEENYRNLCRVPEYGARNFFEAVQSIWFTFAFLRLCGNWPGIGRLDWLLGEYLEKDLADGKLTLDQAREILAHFFIKGCEWITGKSSGSGDAQHYQNIVLSGIGKDGRDVTNEVTYLVLDIVEELGISDFPITVRINKNTDERLLRRVSEVIRHGGGVIAVYNEELILQSLTEYGYPYSDAVNFANDGCWEVQIPGKTNFSYVPFDALAILQKQTLNSYDAPGFASFEELYEHFIADLEKQVQQIHQNKTDEFLRCSAPCTVVSLFENDCISRGISYLEGGTVYTVVSPHIGGLADAANSLYAIKKIVFEEKLVSFSEFMAVLKQNWATDDALRQYALKKITYYGNNNDEADMIAARILDDFALACKKLDGKGPFLFPPGVSTFGRQIEWVPNRLASPHGRKQGEVLSGNFSPTPGTDKESATSIVASYCKADLKKQVTGAALDISLLPSTVSGEDGLEAVMGLIMGFVHLGGYFMQIDVADTKILKQAQEHPEQFPTLSVRVSGWNARFATLNKEWQDMIIERDASHESECNGDSAFLHP